MQTRRKFFKYLGLAGGVATGGVVAAAAVLPDAGKCEAVNEIETNRTYGRSMALTLQQGYGEKKEEVQFGQGPVNDLLIFDNKGTINIGTLAPKTPLKMTSVSMVPGPDGEMYLNVNGKWRRIVTE
jgi:carbohydrate-selective porin OprB